MRKLGIITSVNDFITVLIWDEELKTVVTKQIMNPQNTKYNILSIVEYFSDTNTIALIPDNTLTQEEKKFLTKSLKLVMDNHRYQEIFLNELDILSKASKK